MNDRFKFRMYDTNVNKMYMPNDFEEVESIYECIKQQINWDLNVDYDIKFNHLEDGRFFMQSTGLKDKNGKLIYEGDICEYEFEEIGKQKAIIEFNKKYAAFLMKPLNDFQYVNINECEVIGNKFENPELLKECK